MYDAVAEDRIDPQHVQQWQTSLAVHEPDAPEQESIDARLTGTDGKNRRYAVVAVRDGDDTRWLDPAGFELAVSKAQTPSGSRLFRSDFERDVSRRVFGLRSEEHTYELQSLMRNSYAVF